MTNPNYTAIVLIVDRSSSMKGIAASVQDTLNEFVNSQISLPGNITIDTVFFDDQIENRATLVNPAETPLNLELEPRGMTALYDAVGLKIDSFGKTLSTMEEKERPGKVIFVIATDGLENSSKEITQEALAERIGHQREVYGWDFTFIGANQDAVLTANVLNIPKGSAITFAATTEGTESVLRSMSSYVASSRAGAPTAYSVADRASAMTEAGTPERIKVTAHRGGGAAKSRGSVKQPAEGPESSKVVLDQSVAEKTTTKTPRKRAPRKPKASE